MQQGQAILSQLSSLSGTLFCLHSKLNHQLLTYHDGGAEDPEDVLQEQTMWQSTEISC
jgi:hypothetical protein